MIVVLTIILCITIVAYSHIKKSKKTEIPTSQLMDSYYESLMSNNKQKSYNLLRAWCSDLMLRIQRLEKYKEVLEPLYNKRLVSDSFFEKTCSNLKSLHNEKTMIEQEAREYNRDVFKESKILKEEDKTYRIIEDIHFNNKREALEMELKKRLFEKVNA